MPKNEETGAIRVENENPPLTISLIFFVVHLFASRKSFNAIATTTTLYIYCFFSFVTTRWILLKCRDGIGRKISLHSMSVAGKFYIRTSPSSKIFSHIRGIINVCDIPHQLYVPSTEYGIEIERNI